MKCEHDVRILKNGNEFCQKCWSEWPSEKKSKNKKGKKKS